MPPILCISHFMVRLLLVFFFGSSLLGWAKYPPEIKEARVETYREVDEFELKVWIVGETVEGEAKPAVVLFFGGGWRFGSPDSLLRHARYLASRGMICLLADYRVANRHGVKISDCVSDAKAAVTWTRANAERLGIDPIKIAAGGASAGGHIAACSALVPGVDSEGRPNALLLFNPALVLAPFEGLDVGVVQRLSEAALGAKPKALSPIHHVTKEAPPTWITHGARDGVVPVKSVKVYRDEMESKGAVCELLIAASMPHAFHYRDPWFKKVMASAEVFFEGLGWLQEEGESLP